MLPDFTDEELAAEIARLEKLEAICSRYGEADGENACRSQLRALRQERAARG